MDPPNPNLVEFDEGDDYLSQGVSHMSVGADIEDAPHIEDAPADIEDAPADTEDEDADFEALFDAPAMNAPHFSASNSNQNKRKTRSEDSRITVVSETVVFKNSAGEFLFDPDQHASPGSLLQQASRSQAAEECEQLPTEAQEMQRLALLHLNLEADDFLTNVTDPIRFRQHNYVCPRCHPADVDDKSTWRSAGRGLNGAFADKQKRDAHIASHKKMYADELAVWRAARAVLLRKLGLKLESDTEDATAASSASPEARHPQPAQNQKQVMTLFVILWCLLCGSIDVVDNHITQEVFRCSGLTASSAVFRNAVIDHEKDLRKAVCVLMKGKTVVVMKDGGTLNRKRFLNYSIAFSYGTNTRKRAQRVFHWKTIEVTSMTAANIKEKSCATIEEIESAGGYVIAIVSDNAANMQAANNQIETEWDAEDIIDSEEIAEGVREKQPGKFIKTCRCWAHTFQLIIGDCCIPKKSSSTAFTRAYDKMTTIMGLLKCSTTRVKLQNAMKEHPELEHHAIAQQPTATRWTSQVVAMKFVLDSADMINRHVVVEKNEAITQKDRYDLRLALICLSPIAWIIDHVQSDDCDAEDGLVAKYQLAEQLRQLRERNYPPTVGEDLNKCIAILERNLKVRDQYFDNDITRLLKMLDHSTNECHHSNPNSDNLNYLREAVISFCKSTDLEYAEPLIVNQVNKFYSRSEAMRGKSHTVYWASGDVFILQLFYAALASVLLSEASVERTFHQEAQIFRPDRSTMAPELLNAFLFIKANHNRMDERVMKPNVDHTSSRNRRRHLTIDEWKTMACELTAPVAASDKMTTRADNKQALIDQLRPGRQLIATYHVNGEPTDFVLTLMAQSEKKHPKGQQLWKTSSLCCRQHVSDNQSVNTQWAFFDKTSKLDKEDFNPHDGKFRILTDEEANELWSMRPQ